MIEDWEEKSLEYLNTCFLIKDSGPLYSPVETLKFRRKDDLILELTTISNISSLRNLTSPPKPKVGAVTKLDTKITLTSRFSKSPAVVYGIHSSGISEHSNTPTRTRIREERCTVQKIEHLPENIKKVVKLAEHIDNFDLSLYHWPDKVETDRTCEEKIYGNNRELLLEMAEHNSGFKSGLEITVGGTRTYVIPGKGKSFGGPNGRATIIYDGYPDENFRDKFRNCLSLAIGVPIVSLGFVLLGDDSEHLGFQIKSPYTIDRAIYKIYALPPTPLAQGRSPLVERETISRIVISYYNNYERFNLRHVSWLYWHAACSATHAQSVQLGGAIESLISSYRDKNPHAYSTGIVEKSVGKQISKALKESLAGIQLDAEQRAQIESKISNINQASQRVINDRFFEHLGLDLGEKEKAAWQRRNDSAHGNPSEKDDTVNLIRDISLLENLFHRTLLKITSASLLYIDRYTEGHPIRMLTESVNADIRPGF